ncbi:MAG: zinc ribbon domain-containing protein [candidate division KSB1 bacterium]
MKPIKIFSALACALLLLIQSAAAQEEVAKANFHCPYCSAVNLATSTFCNACGARLPERRVENLDARDSAVHVDHAKPELFIPANKEAEALYETAMAFIRQNHFAEAANCFHGLAQEFPASEYARSSTQMARACEELAQAQRQSQQKDGKREPSNSAAFSGAFVGSLVGMVGTIVLILALASGG